jgi:hypothetical protein
MISFVDLVNRQCPLYLQHNAMPAIWLGLYSSSALEWAGLARMSAETKVLGGEVLCQAGI